MLSAVFFLPLFTKPSSSKVPIEKNPYYYPRHRNDTILILLERKKSEQMNERENRMKRYITK